MSAPLIWIVIPGLVSIILYFLVKWQRLVTWLGVVVGLGLSIAAWKLPINEQLTIGPWSFKVIDTLMVFGRRFILTNQDRPILVIIYILVVFWWLGSLSAKPGRLFTPLGLGIVSLMVASLAVEPVLFAALFIEVAILLCIPIICPPGKKPGRGILRFLTYQTIGVPFILFAGWGLSILEQNPNSVLLPGQVMILLAIGFCFLLAVFPFHTWIPMLAEEAHPYAVGFIYFIIPGIVSLFGLSLINKNVWLRNSEVVFGILRSTGILMVIIGGVWVIFQSHLGRIMGYAVIIDLGLSILSVGVSQEIYLSNPTSTPYLDIFFDLLISRGIILSTWALALSIIYTKKNSLDFREIHGIIKQLPVTSVCLILAQFALAGYPLLAGFSARMKLWTQIAQTISSYSFLAILGCVGLLLSGLRMLFVLVSDDELKTWRIEENNTALTFLIISILLLFVLGLFLKL